MANKLANKNIRIYSLISICALILTSPIFYSMIGKLWIEDIDESMIYEKEELISNIKNGKLSSSDFVQYITISHKLGGTINILPLTDDSTPLKDSIYYHTKYDNIHGHVEPYREYRSSIKVEEKLYQIIFTRDLVESEDLIESIGWLFFILFSILLIMNFAVMSYYSKHIWRPFFSMINQLKDLRLTQKSKIDVDCKRIYEFEELHQSINELLEKNHKIFIAQKEFTENAAHEIQTPISVIKMQIDLLRQKTKIENTEDNAIQIISKNIRYITSLNRNLLLLSKIENQQFLLSEKVCINTILEELIENVGEELQMVSKKIIFTGENVVINNCSEHIVRSLCNNLLTNAIKYSKNESCIDITLTYNELIFSNLGTEKALDKNRIFNRFYKENPSTSGSGLGLSIIKSICKILNFGINYQFNNENRHTFTVKF